MRQELMCIYKRIKFNAQLTKQKEKTIYGRNFLKIMFTFIFEYGFNSKLKGHHLLKFSISF